MIMTVLGLLLATIGMDNVSGVARFTYNIPNLYSGIEFLTVAVGLFALGEVFRTILDKDNESGKIAKVGRILPTKQDMKESSYPYFAGIVARIFYRSFTRCRRNTCFFLLIHYGEEIK